MKLSVAMITYNHEKYIAQAIESVLMQQCRFSIELIIGDDNSTDRTRRICENYQQQFPDTIKLFAAGPNIGMMKNVIRTRQACTGDYIAFLEGDDFWTDPLKLQKQVDFLEANPEFSFCFHNVNILNEAYPDQNKLNNNESTPELIGLDELVSIGNMAATASVVLRSKFLRDIPEWFNALPFGDYPVYLLLAKQGKVRYFKDVMATYRIHAAGAHGHLTNSRSGLVKAYQKQYQFWKIIRKHRMIDRGRATAALLKATDKIIENAIGAGQTKVLLHYNFLLVVHSRGAGWRKAVSNLLIMYRYNRKPKSSVN